MKTQTREKQLKIALEYERNTVKELNDAYDRLLEKNKNLRAVLKDFL